MPLFNTQAEMNRYAQRLGRERKQRRRPPALPAWFRLFFGVGLLFVAAVWSAGTEPAGISVAIRGGARAPSTFVNDRVLAANVAETVTAPTFASYPSAKALGIFSATCSNWYYSKTGTAAVPAADVTDGGASARAPVSLVLPQGGTISIVADATCTVTTEWYVVREP